MLVIQHWQIVGTRSRVKTASTSKHAGHWTESYKTGATLARARQHTTSAGFQQWTKNSFARWRHSDRATTPQSKQPRLPRNGSGISSSCSRVTPGRRRWLWADCPYARDWGPVRASMTTPYEAPPRCLAPPLHEVLRTRPIRTRMTAESHGPFYTRRWRRTRTRRALRQLCHPAPDHTSRSIRHTQHMPEKP